MSTYEILCIRKHGYYGNKINLWKYCYFYLNNNQTNENINQKIFFLFSLVKKKKKNLKMNTPGFNEDFLEFESKVNQVMRLLEDISNANKKEGEEVKKP